MYFSNMINCISQQISNTSTLCSVLCCDANLSRKRLEETLCNCKIYAFPFFLFLYTPRIRQKKRRACILIANCTFFSSLDGDANVAHIQCSKQILKLAAGIKGDKGKRCKVRYFGIFVFRLLCRDRWKGVRSHIFIFCILVF